MAQGIGVGNVCMKRDLWKGPAAPGQPAQIAENLKKRGKKGHDLIPCAARPRFPLSTRKPCRYSRIACHE
jgi:hypothetical protein